MSHVLRLAIVDPRDDSREKLKAMLLGMDTVWLEAECSRYEFFPDVISQTKPDVGLICVDSDPEKAIGLVERVRQDAPDCSILIASQNTDGQLILRAMRAGAREFLTLPISIEELISALNRVADQKFGGTEGRTRNSRIIPVCGATGGVGCTSLAVNLACVLAQKPENTVVLVDLDFAVGDADVFLDTIPEYTIVDVTQNIARLDFQLLKRSLTKHSSGLYLLPRPVHLHDSEMITPEVLRRIFGLLKATFTHVIIDLSKGFTAIDLASLEFANDVLVVIQLDLPCLRNLVRLLASFDEIDGLKEKLKIVVNRVGLDSGQISLKKARDTIGRDIYFQVPNEYKTMIEVRNNGVPLIEQAPKAQVTAAICELADMLEGKTSEIEGDEENEKPAGGANWLSFWPGKGGKVRSR